MAENDNITKTLTLGILSNQPSYQNRPSFDLCIFTQEDDNVDNAGVIVVFKVERRS